MFQLMLVTALCLDAFAASFAYGIHQTRIPVPSAAVISLVCTASLAVSTAIGAAAKQIIPVHITEIICFLILLAVGLMKMFDFWIKRLIAACQTNCSQFEMKLFDVNFVLSVYADNIKADADHTKELSSKEAVTLALALSLDGFAAGFGCGLTAIQYGQLILLSLVSNILAVSFGYLLGKFLTRITSLDFSWLGGVILILLAFTKL